MTNGGGNAGFQGGAVGGFGPMGMGGMWGAHGPQGAVPKPQLERDFQMSLQVNPKIGVGPTIWGQKGWMSFVSGHWNGRWGKGTVVVSLYSHSLRGLSDSESHSLAATPPPHQPLIYLQKPNPPSSFKPMTLPLQTSTCAPMAGLSVLETSSKS